MHSEFKIDVVVPVYDVDPSLLLRCINSLRMQTLRKDEYEIILVDDASTLASNLDILDEFGASVPNAQVVRHQHNQGLNAARRSGFQHGSSKFVVFVDGDDVLARDGLEALRAEAHRTRADLVAGPFWRWDADGYSLTDIPLLRNKFAEDRVERILNVFALRSSVTMCGRLFKRDILKDGALGLEKKIYHEDMISFINYMRETRLASQINRAIYFYTFNRQSITMNYTEEHIRDLFWTFRQWIEVARDEGIYERAIPFLSEGLGKQTNTCISRTVKALAHDTNKLARQLCFIRELRDEFKDIPRWDSLPLGDKLWTYGVDEIEEKPHQVAQNFVDVVGEQTRKEPPPFRHRLEPTHYARRLKDRVVLIAQVDYQLRHAAAIATELFARGYSCVVLDNSKFAAQGKRRLPPDEKRRLFERVEYIEIPKPPYGYDWLSTAKVVLVFNDFNDDFREALEFRNLLGMPTISAVEGINDFLRIDFRRFKHSPFRDLPYRRCDHVFLPGEDDSKYFNDRTIKVVGLPIIDNLIEKRPNFPSEPLVAVNVNFTYHVFEDARDAYVDAVHNVVERLGYDWLITQHPMDRGSLHGVPITSGTQYQLIDDCTVFVSRFATGILEALAAGKPVIYFNPHGERVAKYSDPMGAFRVAETEAELEAAIKSVVAEVAQGVDFRTRALPFLKAHTDYSVGARPSTVKFAEAIVEVVKAEADRDGEMQRVFFDNLERTMPCTDGGHGVLLGEYGRVHCAQLQESVLVSRLLGPGSGVMIDVGAGDGQGLGVFAGKDWKVHAFEPDAQKRAALLDLYNKRDNVVILAEAVTSFGSGEVPLYSSKNGIGGSSLLQLTAGHVQTKQVRSVTLAQYARDNALQDVRVLRVDAPGVEYLAFEGFPWSDQMPEAVIVRFDTDQAHVSGFTPHDLARAIVSKGYVLYVSQWQPTMNDGRPEDWCRLFKYKGHLKSNVWGYFIGFKKDPGEEQIAVISRKTLRFSKPRDREYIQKRKMEAESTKATGGETDLATVPTNSAFAQRAKAALTKDQSPAPKESRGALKQAESAPAVIQHAVSPACGGEIPAPEQSSKPREGGGGERTGREATGHLINHARPPISATNASSGVSGQAALAFARRVWRRPLWRAVLLANGMVGFGLLIATFYLRGLPLLAVLTLGVGALVAIAVAFVGYRSFANFQAVSHKLSALEQSIAKLDRRASKPN